MRIKNYLWIAGTYQSGKPETFERVFRVTEYGSNRKVQCSVKLIMEHGLPVQDGSVDKWSLAVSTSGHELCLPTDTIFNQKGLGIGTFLRDRVVEQAKVQFKGMPIKSAWLSPQDANEENFKRREKFYTSGGFDVSYSDKATGDGNVLASSIDKLKVSKPVSEYYILEDKDLLGLFIDRHNQHKTELNEANRELKETSKQRDKHLKNARRAYWVLIVCAIIIFILFNK